MTPAQVKEADEVLNELDDIDAALKNVTPERQGYSITIDQGMSNARRLDNVPTGVELHAWLTGLRAARVARLKELGVDFDA